MSKYKITLTPVDKFFFGGDMTFQVGNDKNDKFNSQYSSYIIQSAMFPQQTSLLGMLRFLILRNAGENVFKDNKIVDTKKASELIGSQSFKVNTNHEENGFGAIKKISHVSVIRDGRELDFAPLFGEINSMNTLDGILNFSEIKVPNLSKEQYDAKKDLTTHLFDGKNQYELSNIFKEDRRIGIARSVETGRTDDGALFKQISYRFNNQQAKHCFVFYADVDDLDLKAYDGDMVAVGGDNSQFVISVSLAEEKNTNDSSSDCYVTLLSPAFLSRADVRENSKYAITKLMPFRFLTDRKDNKENDGRAFHVLNSKLERSGRYELYAPGSVFYFDGEEQKKQFIKIIESKKEFRQIGYNEYK